MVAIHPIVEKFPLVMPEGMHDRPFTLADAPGVVEVFNRVSQKMTGQDDTSLEEALADWNDPVYVPERDGRVMVNADGKVVGFIEFYDMGQPHARFYSFGRVDPDYTGRGVGRFLLSWVLQRSLDNLELAEPGTRVSLLGGVNEADQAGQRLFQNLGFRLERVFSRMRIDFDQPPQAPVLPEGISLRTTRPEDNRQVYLAVYDAFMDHYGFVPQPFEDYYERMMHFLESDPYTDYSLRFVAEEGGEIAGFSLCNPRTGEDPNLGWVGQLGVRRAWRRKGLGLALLLHSFNEMYARGLRSAGLWVDSDSLTGATRLYEKAGMHVQTRSVRFEYELRAGKEMGVMSL